ncbi:MAG: hypothetical protein IT355_17175 [Gemmatimonadaceae bacterium]|nr:hypothetical protein [Gemmatimonadaceae bacterium]
MHPELFELKALVAGRLDLHRRREIDDHLGSCAECSRHYVAMMLGSSSPKTSEQEARAGMVAAAAAPVLAGASGGASLASAYGIDAPLAPPAPRPAPRVPNTSHALEVELGPSTASSQVPVSPSLVDAITKFRTESDLARGVASAAAPAVVPSAPAPKPVAAAPAPSAAAQQAGAPAAPVRAAAAAAAPDPVPAVIIAAETVAPESSLIIEPSIFMPTPLGGVSIINPPAPAAFAPTPDRAAYIAKPKAPSEVPVTPPTPELVVTFSSTPTRFKTHRSPAASPVVEPTTPRAVPLSDSEIEYVSQSVPTSASVPLPEFPHAEPAHAPAPSSKSFGMLAGGVAVMAVLAIGGVSYFRSSVSAAAAAAASAAAKQVTAAAAAQRTPAAAPVSPAPVQTRVVYVERPSRKKDEKPKEAEAPTVVPTAPTAVVILPDVNLPTGPDASLQSNTQRSATSELTRSARATAMRTATPRP